MLAVDALDARGGQVAELAPETLAALGKVLPAAWSKGDPVDIIGDAGPERYEAALTAVLADPDVDAVLVINCPTAVADSTDAAEAVLKVIAAHEPAAGGADRLARRDRAGGGARPASPPRACRPTRRRTRRCAPSCTWPTTPRNQRLLMEAPGRAADGRRPTGRRPRRSSPAALAEGRRC